MMDAGSRLTIVSVVHGHYHGYVDGWIAQLRRVGCRALVHLIVLDSVPLEFTDPAVRVEHVDVANPVWGSGDYIRLRRIRELCSAGITCLQIDIDTWFNEDPCALAGLPHAFIISRGLGFPAEAVATWGFSMCTGFYIAKPDALALLDGWISQQHRGHGLDQDDLNRWLLESGLRWKHARSRLVRDAMAVSADDRICVLSDRTITRDARPGSFGAIHSQSVLERFGRACDDPAP